MKQEVESIIKFVNLVTFDVCSVESLTITDTVDPLKKIASCNVHGTIQKDLHTFLRKTIKSSVIDKDIWVGKIEFLPHKLNITVYKKRLHKPAYTPND